MSDHHTDDSSEGKRRPSNSLAPKLTVGAGMSSIAGGGRRKSTFQKLAMNQTQNLHARRLTKAFVANTETPDETIKPKIRLENTYKMKPDDGQQFSSCRVKEEISNVFNDYLDKTDYDPKTCGKTCCDLSLAIKNRVKNLNYPRYKYVCNVVMGPCCDQGLETASRALWDSKTDNFSCFTYKNKNLFAIGTVHGIFLE